MGRRELIALISAIMAFTAMGIDVMLSAFGEIRDDFGLASDSTQTARVVTIFLLGLAVGQLFYGPIADRFGRKRALYAGASIYIFGAILSALAPTFDTMLAGRFVWGIGAAGARVVATSIVRDRFEGAAMASAMSNVMAVFVLVPIIAPSLGAFLISIAPWRSIFWFCVVFAIVVVTWSFRMVETLDPANRRELDVKTITGGYWTVAKTPVTFGYTMATVFIQASFTAFLASAELLTGQIWDREQQFPVIFGVIAIFFGVAAIVNGRIVERLGIDTVVNRAFGWLAAVISALLAVTYFGGGTPNFWIFTPLMGLTLASFMFLMPNLSSAAMVPLGQIAGSGSALTGSVRVALGALIGGVIAEKSQSTVTPLVVGIALLVACAALTVWLVRRGGIRAVLARTPVLDRTPIA